MEQSAHKENPQENGKQNKPKTHIVAFSSVHRNPSPYFLCRGAGKQNLYLVKLQKKC
jgi:hypothetical protein